MTTSVREQVKAERKGRIDALRSPTTWFRAWPLFLTVNEGHGPMNFALGWLRRGDPFFWYVFAFGHRWYRGMP